NNQNSENPVGSFEGHAHPIQRGRTNQFDLTLLDQRVKHLRSTKQRFAGAEDVFSETAAELFGLWPRICFVDEVGKAKELSHRIVQRDVEISRIHQLRDGSVNRAIELVQVFGWSGFFGDAIERRTERLRPLLICDVAVYNVGGDLLTCDT